MYSDHLENYDSPAQRASRFEALAAEVPAAEETAEAAIQEDEAPFEETLEVEVDSERPAVSLADRLWTTKLASWPSREDESPRLGDESDAAEELTLPLAKSRLANVYGSDTGLKQGDGSKLVSRLALFPQR